MATKGCTGFRERVTTVVEIFSLISLLHATLDTLALMSLLQTRKGTACTMAGAGPGVRKEEEGQGGLMTRQSGRKG